MFLRTHVLEYEKGIAVYSSYEKLNQVVGTANVHDLYNALQYEVVIFSKASRKRQSRVQYSDLQVIPARI